MLNNGDRAEGRVEFEGVRFHYGPPVPSPLAPEAQPHGVRHIPSPPAGEGQGEGESGEGESGEGESESHPEVLRGINLTIEPGQRVAVLGAPGSGKSAMVSLIPRFYDVTSGRITLDNRDVRDLNLRSLRRNVAIVPQDVFLFAATRRDGPEWKALYAKRQAIERVFKSMKESRRLERHCVRGLRQITLHALMSALAFLVTALAHLRAGSRTSCAGWSGRWPRRCSLIWDSGEF